MAGGSEMESLERLKDRNILVTGGTGFIGSHVVEGLLKEGSHVVVPYRTIHPVSYFQTQGLGTKTQLVIGDVKDEERLFDIITKYEIEYIFHLAAQPIVETAYFNPSETLASNIMGTVHILEAARKYS